MKRNTARARFAQLGCHRAGNDFAAGFFSCLHEAASELGDLRPETVALARELVAIQWPLSEAERRALALAVLAVQISARRGSTRLPIDPAPGAALGRIVTALLGAAGAEHQVAAALADIERLAATAAWPGARPIGKPGDYRPLIVADGCLYQQRMHSCEEALIARLEQRLAPGRRPVPLAATDLDRALRSGHKALPYRLSSEQLAAVRRSLCYPLTVITGGPGSGKTAVIAALVAALDGLGLPARSIAIAAPTGKAAQRIASVLAQAGRGAELRPQTLHRLLGYTPATDQFRHHQGAPLRAACIIVDEASMVDMFVMERLFAAAPAETAIVLIGDADQLPSVAAGAVLRDLVDAGAGLEPGFVVHLRRSHRMISAEPGGRHLLEVAGEVRQGRAPRSLVGPGVTLLDTEGDSARVRQFVDAWYRDAIANQPGFARLAAKIYRAGGGQLLPADRGDLDALFALHQESRLLTATRGGECGADAINRQLHERMLRAQRLGGSPDFVPGEPVLVGKNDYLRDLFNGDHGVVIRVSNDGMPPRHCAAFPRADGYALFHLGALAPHLELAFALTVHKAQGSEFDRVAVILPPRDVPLLSRELVYTAITRARRSAVLVARRDILAAALGRGMERYSGLADKLRPPRT